MMTFPTRFFLPALVMGMVLASTLTTASAADKPVPKPGAAINLPPSADLAYSIKAKQSGLSLDGDALVQWSTSGKIFTVTTETRAQLVGKIGEAKSEGVIDAAGLAPLTFIEKRFRKEPTTTTFNRTNNTVNFGGSGASAPLKAGQQDRNSAIWQLIALARGTPAAIKVGTEWTFMVAGANDAEPWTFKVTQQEKIGTRFGELATFHVIRKPPPESKGQQLDIWLAPAQEWYPVRLKFVDADGEFIEQTLEKISKK